MTSSSPVAATGLTAATVNKSLAHLATFGIVSELSSRRRDRVFEYTLPGGAERRDGAAGGLIFKLIPAKHTSALDEAQQYVPA